MKRKQNQKLRCPCCGRPLHIHNHKGLFFQVVCKCGFALEKPDKYELIREVRRIGRIRRSA